MSAVQVGPDATALMPAVAALPPSVMAARPDVRAARDRVVSTLSNPAWPMLPAYTPSVNAAWFRPALDTVASAPDTVATDRSLREFHEVWSRRTAVDVVLNTQASPASLVMRAVGHPSFDGEAR